MRYNATTGRRVKDSNGINWVHSVLKKKGKLSNDYNLCQCLFGEHLLTRYPDKIVAINESEKSALLASGVFPVYDWLATGGKSQRSIDKMKVQKDRTVILFPDADGFKEWTDKAKLFTFCKATVSTILETNASEEERANKIDIGDWLIKSLQDKQEPTPAPPPPIEAAPPTATPPPDDGFKNVGELIDYCDKIGFTRYKVG